MQRCQLTLEEMGYTADLNNSTNLLQIVRRLPLNLRSRWIDKADTIIDMGREPTFNDLSCFVDKCSRSATNMYGQDIFQTTSAERRSPQKPITGITRATTLVTMRENPADGNAPKCWQCGHEHETSSCKLFADMSYEDRRKLTREKGLCYNCLARGHKSKDCQHKSRCSVEMCTWKHLTLLHPPTAPVQPPSETGNSFSSRGSEQKIFLRIVPISPWAKGSHQYICPPG